MSLTLSIELIKEEKTFITKSLQYEEEKNLPCSWINKVNLIELILPKVEIQIQCNTYQNISNILHTTRKKP